MPEDDPMQPDPTHMRVAVGRHWTSSTSTSQKIAIVVFGILTLGLLVLLGIASLLVGSVVLVVFALVWGVMRAIAFFRGGRTSTDTLRSNVRVIRKDAGSQ